jgi:ribosomal protein S12 methylthiotransferase
MASKATVALLSLGCPKNLVDSQAMLGLLEQAGYEVLDELEQAEVVIVNTCAFIEPAQEEAIDALLDVAEMKQGKCRALICAGCLSQRHGEQLLQELPEVDVFLGVGAVPRVVEAVELALGGKRAFVDAPLSYLYTGATPRMLTGPAWLAYLKIADGCNHRCAFCTIPAIRGPYRSVPSGDVCRQLVELGESGAREVCLIAQDTSAWGQDLEPRGSLPQLLDDMAAVDYNEWLRLLYLHPTSLDEETVARVCGGAPFVPYFDIPLQHASRRVLQAMGRAGDAERFLGLLEMIRRHDPKAAIRTTFIVGFPGETPEDFETLLQFVQAARFDRLSAFRYWPEAGTRAAQMPDQVPMDEADERLEELLRVQEEISLEINQGFVGRRLKVLTEGPIEGSRLWRGRTYRDAPEVDAEVKLALPGTGMSLEPGQFVEVEITGAEVHDLRGRVV